MYLFFLWAVFKLVMLRLDRRIYLVYQVSLQVVADSDVEVISDDAG